MHRRFDADDDVVERIDAGGIVDLAAERRLAATPGSSLAGITSSRTRLLPPITEDRAPSSIDDSAFVARHSHHRRHLRSEDRKDRHTTPPHPCDQTNVATGFSTSGIDRCRMARTSGSKNAWRRRFVQRPTAARQCKFRARRNMDMRARSSADFDALREPGCRTEPRRPEAASPQSLTPVGTAILPGLLGHSSPLRLRMTLAPLAGIIIVTWAAAGGLGWAVGWAGSGRIGLAAT
jgi:hypothetical protein